MLNFKDGQEIKIRADVSHGIVEHFGIIEDGAPNFGRHIFVILKVQEQEIKLPIPREWVAAAPPSGCDYNLIKKNDRVYVEGNPHYFVAPRDCYPFRTKIVKIERPMVEVVAEV